MITDRTLAMARDLVTPLDDTLSVYLTAPPPSVLHPVADAERRWRNLEERMRTRGVDQPTLHTVWTPARAAAAVRCGVAVFARHGRVVLTQRLSGWTGRDLATFGAPAHVVPLLGWLRTLVPHVVVDGPEITAFQDAGHPLASIRGSTDHAVRIAHTINAHLVLAVGAAPNLGDQPDLVIDRVPDDRPAHLAEAVRRYAAAQQDALLIRFDNLRGPAGVAVDGLVETLAALAEDRVTTLIVADGLREQPIAWFAQPPAAVALNPAEVFERHQAVRRGPLVDVAVRAALLAGADIWVVPPDSPGGPIEGLGALCRPRRTVGALRRRMARERVR